MRLIALLFLFSSFAAQAATWTPISKLLADGTACSATTNYQSRWNATASRIEVCYWNGTIGTWNPALSGGSGILTLLPGSTACDVAHDNQVRINSTRTLEYCNPTTHAWQAVATGSAGGTLLYTVGGTYSWTVPAGVTSATIWAGGEGGGYGAIPCCWPDYSSFTVCPAAHTPGNSSYVTGMSGTVVAGYGGQSGDSGGANGGWFGQSGAAASLDGYTAGKGKSSWGGIGKSTVSVSSGTTYTIVVAGGGGRCDNPGMTPPPEPTTPGFVAIIY